jgi:hypothetical protein
MNTRIIAVDMPNDESVSIRWRTYLTTVDDIESKTGFDFLSAVPKKIQTVIEARKDTDSDPAENAADKTTEDKSTSTKSASGDKVYMLGPKGGCYYLTASGNKKYVDQKFCQTGSSAGSIEEKKPVPEQSKTSPESKPPASKSNSDWRTYIKGERGGCYYISSSGKKVYVKNKELCNQ